MGQKDHYDVVVIGSGLGGLASAALLAHAGYRTLLTERLPFLGGRFSTVEYKGFKCCTGAIGIELGGVMEGIYREVGAPFQPTVAPTWYRIDGKNYQLPHKAGMKALMTWASGSKAEAEKIMTAFRRALSWMEPSYSINLRDWLLQYTRDENVLSIFQAIVSSLHLINANELPAGEYFRFIKESAGFRMGYAPQGNIVFVEELARTIRRNGGDLWTRCQTKRILVNGGKVEGVVIEKKDKEIEIKAQVVVSNVGPQETVELTGSQNFDKGYTKQMKETLKSAPAIWIHVAADRPLTGVPTLVVCDSRRLNVIGCPTLVCPDLAPPGKHLLVIGAPLESSLPPYNLEKEIKLTIQDMRDIMPGFEKHCEIIWVAVFQRGWPGYRSWPGYDLPQKTPIENLYNVGDGVRPPGRIGLPAVCLTARLVFEDIKRRIKPMANSRRKKSSFSER
jgi:phytoene dehydrogenase-like protein